MNRHLEKRLTTWAFTLITVLLAASGALHAQQNAQFQESYLRPNATVQDVLTRENHADSLYSLSPDGDHFVIPVRAHFSSLQLMTQRTLRLGMLEICPDVNREWRLSTTGLKGLRIYSLSGRDSRDIQLPAGSFVSDTTWSPDGKRLAFLAHLREGTQVWVADAESGRAEPLNSAYVMATLSARRTRGNAVTAPSTMLQWTPDGSIIALLVPRNRGPEPVNNPIPNTPIIRRTRETPSPTPTWPFLLRTPHDKALFRYYTTSQLALLTPGESARNIGSPAMYMNISMSPDGRHILAEKTTEPFSLMVSYTHFPRELQVMDLQGNVLSTVRKVPLQEGGSDFGPGGSAGELLASLPREVAWRPDGKGLSVLWREEQEDDSESSDSDSSERVDRLMLLTAPFDIGRAQTIVSTEKRLSGVSYSRDGRYAFATEAGTGGGRTTGRGDGNNANRDIVAFDLTAGGQRHVLAGNVDPTKVTQLPGDVVTRTSGNGDAYALVAANGNSAYLQGQGYKEDFRHRPFIDRVTIASGQKARIFESASDMFEQPLVSLDDDMNQMIVSRESKTLFPDSYLRSSQGSMQKLTNNRNPFPEVAGVERIDFEFQRRDGLRIHARLSLPVNYRRGTQVPGVFWTYPREYQDSEDYQNAAIQARNHNEFHQLDYRNASDIWLLNGYAVIEPDIPIVGEGQRYNDNYIAHLVDSMYGAMRKVDEMGQVDVDRLGHGGHSYGAFATANVLAHSPFFKAGIAGDGAFNRTLTPMRFQGERRLVWQAQQTYLEMSPFFSADHIDTPLLMYHGAQDNNTGTFLIQSERLIQALTGLGKTAVLYIYPYESHGPACQETYMDLWARWLNWFDTYVKNDARTQQVTEGQSNFK